MKIFRLNTIFPRTLKKIRGNIDYEASLLRLVRLITRK